MDESNEKTNFSMATANNYQSLKQIDTLEDNVRLIPNSKWMSIYVAFCMMIVNFLDRILRFSVFSAPISYWNGTNTKEYLGIATSSAMCIGMFMGIYFISKTDEKYRKIMLLSSMIILCWLPGLTFITEIDWIIILGKFIGTLPEGIFSGIIVTYLEGRKKTDIYTGAYYLGSMLGRPASNTIGTYLSNVVGTKWVPVSISALSFVPLLIVTLLITAIPKPSSDDKMTKCERKINMANAKYFWWYFSFGIMGIIVTSGTIFGWRTYRDYFTIEIYSQELGYNPQPWVYFMTDMPGVIVPLIMFIYLNKIRSNTTAFVSLTIYILVAVTIVFFICMIAVFDNANPYVFLIMTALASYMLIPTIFPLFDRLVAISKAEISTLYLKNLSDGFNNLFATIILVLTMSIPFNLQLEIYEYYGMIIGGFDIIIFILSIAFIYLRIKDYQNKYDNSDS
jgi:hypothetical protein